MGITSVIYTSETGHTREYARLFGKMAGLDVYDIDKGKRVLAKGSPVIYMGWLMAGKVKGLKKAEKYFSVSAVCGVGMSPTGSQTDDMRRVNNIPSDMPLFSLQGGIEYDKYTGVKKLMMNSIRGTALRSLEKKERNPFEDDMLDIIKNGGNRVSSDNLKELLAWYLKGEKNG